MKKKNGDDYYFTKKHEEAIINYCLTNDLEERTRLYIEYIAPSFEEMIDKIIFSYKFTSLPNILDLKEECLLFLITILDKFDVNRGYKAFSYFSVVTKNYFINKVKKNILQNKRELQYETLNGNSEICNLVVDENYMERRENYEFMSSLNGELDKWESINLKENEKSVLRAIKYLMDNLDKIDILNKKAFYLYLRELTNLNTKQVVVALNRIRMRYRLFKKKWNRGEI